MANRYSAYRRGSDTVPPDVIDRLLVGVCAVVWLVLLGVSVAAAVALVDLGSGYHKVTGGNGHTSWVLYAVIVVSALIIAGAIPVLVRARRMGLIEPSARSTAGAARPDRPPVRLMSPAPRTGAERSRQPRAQGGDAATEWSGAAVDRVWLRGTVLLAGTMGAALIAVAAATYLMAIGQDGPAWVGYGLAGAVTAVLPVVEWLHIRQLRRVSPSR